MADPKEKASQEERIGQFRKELDAILSKYNMKISASLKFPVYNKLPVEVSLALKVIENHEGEFGLTYKALEEKKEENANQG